VRRLGLVLVLAAGLVGRAGAELPPVTTQTLSNGLHVVLAPDPSAASIHLTMGYATAPLTGVEGRPASTAAILAELLASEPATDAKLTRTLLGWGAAFSHSVGPDGMYFETTVAPGGLDDALALEVARMRPLEVTQDRLDATLAERRAQWALAQTDPATMGIVELSRAAFEGHPYGRLVGGPQAADPAITPASIAAAERDAINTGNAVLVLAGRFDSDQALDLVRRRFGPVRRATPPRVRSAALPSKGAHRVLPLASTRLPIVFIGWRGGPASDRDTPALHVLALAIGSGSESLLGRDAGGENSIYGHVEAHFDASRDASLLSCMVLPRPKADRKATEDALVVAIQKLAAQPLSQQELDRARHQAEARIVFAMQKPEGRANFLALSWMTTGRADPGAVLDALRKVTAADVQRAAASVLVEARRCVVWVVPAAAPDSAETGP
jgi:zinc protease